MTDIAFRPVEQLAKIVQVRFLGATYLVRQVAGHGVVPNLTRDLGDLPYDLLLVFHHARGEMGYRQIVVGREAERVRTAPNMAATLDD